MKLLEHEGKRLLARRGIAIPDGRQWPERPGSDQGWVVKAQVLTGGRGNRGGVVVVRDPDLLAEHANAVREIDFGTRVHGVYVEELLTFDHEFYLAAMINRDSGVVELVASAHGGVDIENVAPELIERMPVDPLIGVAGFQVRELTRRLGLDGEEATGFGAVVTQLHDALVAEDAELIEINPLVRTPSGFVAADCKVVLDDDAVHRHPDRDQPTAWETDGEFMNRCRDLGVIGVDNRPYLAADHGPTVAVLANGAGLTMATYDLIGLGNTDLSGAIELHGALSRGRDHTADVFGALFELDADIVFVNAFYQLRSTEVLAEALLDALERPGAPDKNRIVTRMRGVEQHTSQQLLETAGCYYTSSLDRAARKVVQVADMIETTVSN